MSLRLGVTVILLVLSENARQPLSHDTCHPRVSVGMCNPSDGISRNQKFDGCVSHIWSQSIDLLSERTCFGRLGRIRQTYFQTFQTVVMLALPVNVQLMFIVCDFLGVKADDQAIDQAAQHRVFAVWHATEQGNHPDPNGCRGASSAMAAEQLQNRCKTDEHRP